MIYESPSPTILNPIIEPKNLSARVISLFLFFLPKLNYKAFFSVQSQILENNFIKKNYDKNIKILNQYKFWIFILVDKVQKFSDFGF